MTREQNKMERNLDILGGVDFMVVDLGIGEVDKK